jgi:hypothetical protein
MFGVEDKEKSNGALWRDAIATVETTGRETMRKAKEGSKAGDRPVVTRGHFTQAADEVEQAKLTLGSGSTWCG